VVSSRDVKELIFNSDKRQIACYHSRDGLSRTQ
jgi:hypothetical protein